jgi:hypothetical protein
MAAAKLSQEMIFVCLKFGRLYRSINIDKSDANILKQLHEEAANIVSTASGTNDCNSHRDHIKLFLISPDHQPPSLKLITRSSDLTPTCSIEIIIWRSDLGSSGTLREHKLLEHTYKKPTYCSSCHYFLWGLMKQVGSINESISTTCRVFRPAVLAIVSRLFFTRANVVNYVEKLSIINVLNVCQPIVQARILE